MRKVIERQQRVVDCKIGIAMLNEKNYGVGAELNEKSNQMAAESG